MDHKPYKKTFLLYVLKFAAVFCICYFGTLAVIGLSAPGGYYSEFIQKHLDFVSLLRKSLLNGSRELLSIIGYTSFIPNKYDLRMKPGTGVHVVFTCLGYGVMSFWIAFVVANAGGGLKKLLWIFGGLLLIWLINITRISLLLIAINRHSSFPFFNHHTWFNILAYLMIFILIYFYDRSTKIKSGILKSTS